MAMGISLGLTSLDFQHLIIPKEPLLSKDLAEEGYLDQK
jgi:hypothetical protein